MKCPPARHIMLSVCLLVFQSGCQKAVPKPDTPAPAVKASGPPPTHAEAETFADKMTKAVKAADPNQVNQLIRTEDLLKRLVSDLELSLNDRESFVRGATEKMAGRGFGESIIKATREGSYKLLRIYEKEGRQRVLFRMISSDAVNYHEYSLIRFPDGEVATEDIFIFLTGEPFSQTIRRMLIPMLGAIRLRGSDSEQLKNIEALGEIMQEFQAGRYEKGVSSINRLPGKFKEQRFVLHMYMQASLRQGEAGERDYLAAMEKYRELYPNDASIDFISIDYYFLKKRYDEAIRAIDRIDKAIGGDPYLRVLRSGAHSEAGRFADARTDIEKAITEEPNLINAYWVRIALSLREKNHEDTLTWLKAIVERLNVEFQDLSTVPDYAEFVKSSQHAQWRKWYAQRKKPDTQSEFKSMATLTGHTKSVSSLAFNSDGTLLASGSFAGGDDKAGEVRLWNVEKGSSQLAFDGHPEAVFAVAFSPDGKTVASGSADSTIKLWDVATGKEKKTLRGHKKSVSSVAFSPDGKTIASASWDWTIKLWNIDGTEKTTLKGHGMIVSAVAFSPDGKTLASASWDKTIKLWDLGSKQERASLIGHSDMIFSISFNSDGSILASGGLDKSIRIWDVKGTHRLTLLGHPETVTCVSFGPNSNTVASSSWDKTVKFWDTKTNQELKTLREHIGRVGAVAFSSDGKRLASGSNDKSIKLWGLR